MSNQDKGCSRRFKETVRDTNRKDELFIGNDEIFHETDVDYLYPLAYCNWILKGSLFGSAFFLDLVVYSFWNDFEHDIEKGFECCIR